MDDAFALLDWKRRVFALYQSVRSTPDAEAAWNLWREGRDDLFRTHPQSPLPEAERGDFTGLQYFDYEPQLRVLADVQAAEPEPRRSERVAASPFCSAASRPPPSCSEVRSSRSTFTGSRATAAASSCVRRRDERLGDLRGRALRARLRQGRRPRPGRRASRPRLQLRLQPFVRLRPEMGLSSRSGLEQASDRGQGRRGSWPNLMARISSNEARHRTEGRFRCLFSMRSCPPTRSTPRRSGRRASSLCRPPEASRSSPAWTHGSIRPSTRA